MLKSSVGTNVELRTRRTNQLNQIHNKVSLFLCISLVRRMWRLTFVSETIFTRSIRLKQTDRTCWTIQTHADKLNWARRRTFHELNSLGSSREKFDVWTRPEFFKFHTVSARNSFDFRSAITLERADKLLYIYWHLCVSKPHSMP